MIEQNKYKEAVEILFKEKVWLKDKIFYYEKLGLCFEKLNLNDQALKCYQYLYNINSNNIDYVNSLRNLEAK